MHVEPLNVRYVAVLQVPGGSRLFCSDRQRDEWTSWVSHAESFGALYEAQQVAQRHGGQVLTWADAHKVAATAVG